ncbi:MAG: hypothetical protein ACOYNO_11525 [Saprospiraceae bacterium]
MKAPFYPIAAIISAAFFFLSTSLTAQEAAAPGSAEELAKKLANPVASLISVPFQSNTDVGIGRFNGSRMVLNVQPVVPFSLSENWNLITRYIFPIVSQFDITGENTSQSGLGDAVVSGFFSPKNSAVTWGVGPAFLLPTATEKALGSEKFGVGPSVVALKQSNGWTYGGLANHIVSVAGNDDRSDVNATFLNPFVTYNWKSGAGLSAVLEYTHDWENDVDVTMFAFPSFSGVTKFGKQTVSFGISPRWHFAPETRPRYGVRAAVTAVFPK